MVIFLRILFVMAAFGLLCCQFFAAISDKFLWPFMIFDLFHLHYVISALIILTVLLSLKSYRMAALPIFSACLSAYALAPYFMHAAPTTMQKDNMVVSFNTLHQPAFAQDLDDDIQSKIIDENINPEIVTGLVETQFNINKKSDLNHAYDSNVTIIGEFDTILPPIRYQSMELAQATRIGDDYFIFVHPFPPITPRMSKMQQDFVPLLITYIDHIRMKNPNARIIIGGDFNFTPGTRLYNKMLGADLNHAQCGHFAQSTWPTPVPILAAKLDHLFVSKDIKISCEVWGNYGSDHRPIVAFYE